MPKRDIDNAIKMVRDRYAPSASAGVTTPVTPEVTSSFEYEKGTAAETALQERRAGRIQEAAERTTPESLRFTKEDTSFGRTWTQENQKKEELQRSTDTLKSVPIPLPKKKKQESFYFELPSGITGAFGP